MNKKMISYREMVLADVEAVAALEEDIFPHPWSKESFIEEVTNNKFATYFVALDQEEIIGYAGIWQVLDEGHITNIGVAKAYRGLGIGRTLTKRLLDFGKEKGILYFTLEVRTTNSVAISLYEQLGFTIAGIRKKYYQNKEDAYVMWKRDGEEN